MFYGITDGLMSQLQSVQNAAARLVSGTRRYDHITLVLQELHWLPVWHWVDFKMATVVYLSLSGMAPPSLVLSCPDSLDSHRILLSAGKYKSQYTTQFSLLLTNSVDT